MRKRAFTGRDTTHDDSLLFTVEVQRYTFSSGTWLAANYQASTHGDEDVVVVDAPSRLDCPRNLLGEDFLGDAQCVILKLELSTARNSTHGDCSYLRYFQCSVTRLDNYSLWGLIFGGVVVEVFLTYAFLLVAERGHLHHSLA